MISPSAILPCGIRQRIWHNTLYHILISKIMEKGNRNLRKQPTFVTKAELCWHCLQQIFENPVRDNLHLQRHQSLPKQDPSVSYPHHNKVSTNAVFLPPLLYTLLQRTNFHFSWKVSEKLFSTWKSLCCLVLSEYFQDSGSWGTLLQILYDSPDSS